MDNIRKLAIFCIIPETKSKEILNFFYYNFTANENDIVEILYDAIKTSPLTIETLNNTCVEIKRVFPNEMKLFPLIDLIKRLASKGVSADKVTDVLKSVITKL